MTEKSTHKKNPIKILRQPMEPNTSVKHFTTSGCSTRWITNTICDEEFHEYQNICGFFQSLNYISYATTG